MALAAGLLVGERALAQALGQIRPPRTRFFPPPQLPTTVDLANKRPKSSDESQGSSSVDHAIVSKNGRFKLDFEKVEIADLVQSISDITGKLFIVPENVHGRITIIGPKHGTEWVTTEEAYAAFLAALDANNLTVYPMGRYNKIIEKRDARRKPVPTFVDPNHPIPDTEEYVTRLFRLHHVDPDTVNGLMGELVGPDGMSRPFQPDLLIVADIASNMRRLEKIVEQIDVPAGGDEVRIIQVRFGTAQDLADKLQNIFQDKNKRPGSPRGLSVAIPSPYLRAVPPAGQGQGPQGEEAAVQLTRVVPDERTNKLIVIASPKSFDKIEALVRQLDVPVPGEGQIHVYYLENAVAEQVSTTLTNLISGISAGRKGGPQAPGGPGGNQSVFEGQVKISPDKSTNSLVIVASGSDYNNLVRVIQRLDRSQRQVFIEAVLMEVDLNNELDFGGASHYIANVPDVLGVNGGQSIPIPFGAEPFPLGGKLNSLLGVSGLASLGGFLTGLQGPANAAIGQTLGIPLPSFSILMQAMETSSATNVLSTPHILTTNNEEAEISVGQNVPFQSGFSFGGFGLGGMMPGMMGGLGGIGGASPMGLAGGLAAPGMGGLGAMGAMGGLGGMMGGMGGMGMMGGLGGMPMGQIQRTNVELKLKIKPQINEGDYVRLTVDESNEEITSTDPVLGPTTSKRAIKTVIVAKDQETVVIGGLMKNSVTKSVDKVPVLGDIPVLGWLFRYNTVTKAKLNLLLFLTPYIIRESSDFRGIFERKMEERKEFVERFYGSSEDYHVPIDYARKAGPLGAMTVTLTKEQAKYENGGNGRGTGEREIGPMGPPPAGSVPPGGAPLSPVRGGQPDGSEE